MLLETCCKRLKFNIAVLDCDFTIAKFDNVGPFRCSHVIRIIEIKKNLKVIPMKTLFLRLLNALVTLSVAIGCGSTLNCFKAVPIASSLFRDVELGSIMRWLKFI